MNITDDLKQEATYHLSKYKNMDMTNARVKIQFIKDVNNLVQGWMQSGIYVNADKNSGMNGYIFIGVDMDSDQEIRMCYGKI